MKQTLSKAERLKSYTRIRALFDKGSKIRVQPLLVYFRLYDSAEVSIGSCLQMGVSVSSRHFKRAVDRNLIKRRMRESYRKQKQVLFEALVNRDWQMDLFVVYLGTGIPDYEVLYLAFEKMLNQLVNRIPPSENAEEVAVD